MNVSNEYFQAKNRKSKRQTSANPKKKTEVSNEDLLQQYVSHIRNDCHEFKTNMLLGPSDVQYKINVLEAQWHQLHSVLSAATESQDAEFAMVTLEARVHEAVKFLKLQIQDPHQSSLGDEDRPILENEASNKSS